MSQTFKLNLLLIGLLVIVGLDQYTKWLVINHEPFNAMACLENPRICGKIELSQVFDLSMVWNRGISFGTLQSEGIFRWILFGFQGLIAGFFTLWYLIQKRMNQLDLEPIERRMTGFALVLVISGAVGNMIDRARFGAVVDFLDFSGLGFFPWVFNVADAAVTVGAALLILDFFLTWRKQRRAGEPLE